MSQVLFLVIISVSACAVTSADASETTGTAAGGSKTGAESDTKANFAEHKKQPAKKSSKPDRVYVEGEIRNLWKSFLVHSADVNYLMKKLHLKDLNALSKWVAASQRFGLKTDLWGLLNDRGGVLISDQTMTIADPELGDENYPNLPSIRRDSSYKKLTEKIQNSTTASQSPKAVQMSNAEQNEMLNMLHSSAARISELYGTYVDMRSSCEFITVYSQHRKGEDGARMLSDFQSRLAKAREDLVTMSGAKAVDELDKKRNWARLK